MKTLVLVDHPDLENSIINARWIEELEKYPDKITVRRLQDHFNNGEFDIEEEQKIVEDHGGIIFQFPIFWFSCPSLMKKWLDEVITHGWGFGEGNHAFRGRKTGIAASFGTKREYLSRNGKYVFTPYENLASFATTFLYIDAEYMGHHAFYGAEHNPSQEYIEENTQAYIDFIKYIFN